MSLQLAQSTSTLAQTRNRLNSAIGRLPEEVLYQVFLDVVYAPESMKLSMKKCVRAIYGNLHKLLAVCSAWRTVAISRAALWGTIPAIEDPTRNQAIDLSFERSRGRSLRLAATTTLNGPPLLIKTVVENASRLHALNLQGPFSSQITSIITELLRNSGPSQLSELLIRCSPPMYSQPPRISNYIVEPNSAEQASFNRLIGSLANLSLSGIQVHLETTSSAFSDRLVEPYIHKVGLGSSDSAMVTFISAISSARELRDLKIIDVRAYRNPTETARLVMRPTVMFSRLQSLLLQDLCFNVLEFFLLGISPGSYHLTLSLSSGAFKINYSDGRSEKIILDNVTRLLVLIKVDTLFLPRGSVDDKAWLRGPGLRKLLESTPKLKVLKMRGWHFYEDFCDGLCPPPSYEQQSHGFSPSFLQLEILQLIKVRIRDQERFKQMSTNLSPATMLLSGYVKAEAKKWAQLTEDDSIVDWLNTNVPGFRLVDVKYDVEILEAGLWQLW
ncbi:hypothetical protein OPQ81_011291 [Rhizoctonia solani]|nr:hypothetical protein OPQ81_011291 [Rhizoctonia solani]